MVFFGSNFRLLLVVLVNASKNILLTMIYVVEIQSVQLKNVNKIYFNIYGILYVCSYCCLLTSFCNTEGKKQKLQGIIKN